MDFEEAEFRAFLVTPVWKYLTKTFKEQRVMLQNMLAAELSGVSKSSAMDSYGNMRYIGGQLSTFDFVGDILQEVDDKFKRKKGDQNADQ